MDGYFGCSPRKTCISSYTFYIFWPGAPRAANRAAANVGHFLRRQFLAMLQVPAKRDRTSRDGNGLLLPGEKLRPLSAFADENWEVVEPASAHRGGESRIISENNMDQFASLLWGLSVAMIAAFEKDSIQWTSLRRRVQALERCEAGCKEALAARDSELDALRMRTTAWDVLDRCGQR